MPAIWTRFSNLLRNGYLYSTGNQPSRTIFRRKQSHLGANPYNEENGVFSVTDQFSRTKKQNDTTVIDSDIWSPAGVAIPTCSPEFWNDGPDLRYDPEKVTAWHQEMAQYLREIDPTTIFSPPASPDHETIHSIAAMDSDAFLYHQHG